MNQKYNPWLSLVALLLLALILVFTCTGCAEAEAKEPEAPVETEAETPGRFVVTNERHGGLSVRVITDTATGKEYIVAMSGYAGVALLEG